MRFGRGSVTGGFLVRFCREISEFREFKEGRAVVALSLACEWVSMRYYRLR